MVSSDAQRVCNKHPYHLQQPGVCSCCLRERLSDLSSSSSFTPHTKTTPWMASCPSSFSSSPASASQSHRRHLRNASAVMGSIGFIIRGSRNGTTTTTTTTNNISGIMRKSKSMAFVSRSRGGGGKKKGGFWSKLIRSTDKNTKEIFKNSRTTTVKERF